MNMNTLKKCVLSTDILYTHIFIVSYFYFRRSIHLKIMFRFIFYCLNDSHVIVWYDIIHLLSSYVIQTFQYFIVKYDKLLFISTRIKRGVKINKPSLNFLFYKENDLIDKKIQVNLHDICFMNSNYFLSFVMFDNFKSKTSNFKRFCSCYY
jgi:hypothetical protein